MGMSQIVQKASEYVTWNRFYRGYNAAVAGIVLVDFIQNPTIARAIEYLPDVAIHGVEAIFPNSNNLLINELALVVNAGRMLQAGQSFFTNVSEIPREANLFDIPNHLLNCYHRASNIFQITARETSQHQETQNLEAVEPKRKHNLRSADKSA